MLLKFMFLVELAGGDDKKDGANDEEDPEVNVLLLLWLCLLRVMVQYN